MKNQWQMKKNYFFHVLYVNNINRIKKNKNNVLFNKKWQMLI